MNHQIKRLEKLQEETKDVRAFNRLVVMLRDLNGKRVLQPNGMYLVDQFTVDLIKRMNTRSSRFTPGVRYRV